MTIQEWNALIEILNRTAMSQAERQWLQALINREMAKLQEVKDEKDNGAGRTPEDKA